MEIHSRQMQVNSVTGIAPDKVRVTLGEVQNPGGGPGVAAPMGGGAGGSFSYDLPKDETPKVWDIQTISVNADVAP